MSLLSAIFDCTTEGADKAIQKGNWVVVLTDYVVEEHKKRLEKEKVKGARKIDPARLQWKPPVFTASSRTWNW